jgi:hypothetical protein
MVLKTLRFLILIPHRDGGRPLKDLSRRLFAAGFPGAYSFPAAAPLALLSRPLTKPELRTAAAALRETSLKSRGIITAGKPARVRCSGLSFYGPALDLAAPELPPGGIRFQFPLLTLCAALIPGDEFPENHVPPGFPPFSFRAAAVANMILIPLDAGAPGYSYTWKIGVPRWLPSPAGFRRNFPFPAGDP